MPKHFPGTDAGLHGCRWGDSTLRSWNLSTFVKKSLELARKPQYCVGFSLGLACHMNSRWTLELDVWFLRKTLLKFVWYLMKLEIKNFYTFHIALIIGTGCLVFKERTVEVWFDIDLMKLEIKNLHTVWFTWRYSGHSRVGTWMESQSAVLVHFNPCLG
jgi:hypothetical protein